MDNQTERERIVKKLSELKIHQSMSGRDELGKYATREQLGDIADWHLAEVKRIVEPLNEGFEAVKGMRSKNFILSIYRDAMVKALKRANGGE